MATIRGGKFNYEPLLPPTPTDPETKYLNGNKEWAVVDSMVYPSAGIAVSTGSAWDTSITDNSANWNTAYGWGDHAGLYDPLGAGASAVSGHESTYDHSLLHSPITLDTNADTLLSLTAQELGLDTQVKNRVFAGPSTGADAVPTFRALVADDIPSLTDVYVPYTGATDDVDLGLFDIEASNAQFNGTLTIGENTTPQGYDVRFYSSYGVDHGFFFDEDINALAFGHNNTSAWDSLAEFCVNFGQANLVDSYGSICLGGYLNIVSGYDTNAIVSGYENEVSGDNAYASIIGSGYQNIIDDSYYSGILCGENNQILGETGGQYSGHNFIGSGQSNTIGLGVNYSFIGGGYGNTITAHQSDYAGIAYGKDNTITGARISSIVGGEGASITSEGGCIVGGKDNTVSRFWGVCVGGEGNTVSGGDYGVVIGGANNIANAFGSVVLASQNATVSGNYGFLNAATGIGQTITLSGLRSAGFIHSATSKTVSQNHSWVFYNDITTPGTPDGKFGINTLAPSETLHLGTGTIRVQSFGTAGIVYNNSDGVLSGGGTADNISDGSTNIIPTATQESNWDTAYGWGDHSSGGYVKADGTVALTADWDVGNFDLTAKSLTLDGTFTDGAASLTKGSLTNVKLGSLTTNGFVKTSGSDGTLSVDTTTYLKSLAFSQLTDVQGAYTNAYALYAVDSKAKGLIETTVLLTEPAANQFQLQAGSLSATTLLVTSACTINQNLSNSSSPTFAGATLGNTYFSEYLYHTGDTDTYIRYQTNQVDIYAGGLSFIKGIETAQDIIVFNEDSGDIDMRWESDANANGMFWQASNGYVGVGTGTLDALFHVYAGNSSVTPYAGTQLFVENSAACYLQIGAGNTSEGGLLIGDNGNNIAGYYTYNHSDNYSYVKLTALSGTNYVRYDTSTSRIGYLTSSARYKKDIVDIGVQYDWEDMKDRYLQLNLRSFKYKEGDTPEIGFIAEEVYDIMPELTVPEYENTEIRTPEGIFKKRKPTGRVDAITNHILPFLNHKIISEHEQKIADLEHRIIQLEQLLTK